MKKTFTKIVSAFMVVLMLVFSVPIGQFADLDWSAIGSMFDFKAEAADADTLPVYTEDEEELFNKLGFDPYNLFKDVDMGDADIELPTIPILGKEYSFGTLKGGVKLPLNINIECKVDFDKKTIEVIAGYNRSSSADIGPSEDEKDSKWKDSYNEIKEMYKDVTGKKTKIVVE